MNNITSNPTVNTAASTVPQAVEKTDSVWCAWLNDGKGGNYGERKIAPNVWCAWLNGGKGGWNDEN